MGSWALGAWLPLIVANLLAGTALTDSTASAATKAVSVKASLLSAVPYALSAATLLGIAWSSDRHNERSAHIIAPWLAGGALLACFGAAARASTAAGFAVLSLALAFVYSGQGVLCARGAATGPPSEAAITLGASNAICAGFGGFIGPVVVGAIVRSLRSYSKAAIALGAFEIGAGAIIALLWLWERAAAAAAAAARRRRERDGGGGAGDGGGAKGQGLEDSACAAGACQGAAAGEWAPSAMRKGTLSASLGAAVAATTAPAAAAAADCARAADDAA